MTVTIATNTTPAAEEPQSPSAPAAVLAIDPGSEMSAWVLWDGRTVLARGIVLNAELLAMLRAPELRAQVGHLAIEQIASYGMPVGAEVFETCVWTGRFLEAWRGPHTRIGRLDVKLHLCHDSRAKDPNIRQALLDRFGKPGTKQAPGVTYGITKDLWAALAVAVTWWETERESGRE